MLLHKQILIQDDKCQINYFNKLKLMIKNRFENRQKILNLSNKDKSAIKCTKHMQFVK